MGLALFRCVFAIVLAASVVGSSVVRAFAGNSPATVEQECPTHVYNHALCAAGFTGSFCTTMCGHGVVIGADAVVLSEAATPALGTPAAGPSPQVQPERRNPIRAPPQFAS